MATERVQLTEGTIQPTHRIKVGFPEGSINHNGFKEITGSDALTPYLRDEANFQGKLPLRAIQFNESATDVEVSHWVRIAALQKNPINIRAAGTSLTGASVPRENGVVLDMLQMKKMNEVVDTPDGKHELTVQPGVSFKDMNKKLAEKGLTVPSSPTYDDAAVGGGVSTNAAGARSYKYGPTREYVRGVKCILPSGEVLQIRRGQYIAHVPDETHPDNYYFELETSSGEFRTIPVPTYQMPDVPKNSAGYYAKPNMDLIDLISGSEGTLGVITEITMEAVPKVPTAMALISCNSEAEALKLISTLRKQEPEKRATREPGGISAVEFIGEHALQLLRENKHPGIPKNAQSLLLVQAEMPDGDEKSLDLLADACSSDFDIGMPGDTATQEKFIELREAVPKTVNEKVRGLGSQKVGADPCVKPELLPDLMRIYYEEFGKEGINVYAWGHGEGNFHFNVICPPAQLAQARKIAVICGNRVIAELHGTMMAEHGTGQNAQKKGFLVTMFGEKGVEEMRQVKRAFDPEGILSPGNMFDLSVQTN